jgi:predicted metalloprotease with PDZ domain
MFMKRFILLLLSFGLPGILLGGSPTINYRLSMPRPWTHLFEVEVTFEKLPSTETTLDLVLPVWRTGRYVIFDFAGGVERFTAVDGGGKALSVIKQDKTTWRIATGGGKSVTARYEVYADEFALRTRGLNDEHGFVDGTAVFMYSPLYRQSPLTLTVVPFGDWHVTTGLDSVAGQRLVFTAPGYDHLADCPLEIGTQRDYEFTVDGTPHVLSISGPTNCSADSLMSLASRVVRMNSAYWGGLPYKRYVFILHAMANPAGATEHVNSCVIDFGLSRLRTPDPCRNLLGSFSHEFFHTWNVKQFRPKAMDTYDWTKENYSRELWLVEGGTSYVHGLLLARNGLTSAKGYIEGLHRQIEDDRQRPGNREESATECSFDAWVKYFRNLPEAYNFGTDLYGKGQQVSMLMDLTIRHESENRASLDDLMHTLYKRFPIGSGGYTVDDLESIAVELAGKSMHDFFARYVRGTAPLDWETVLGYAGLVVRPVEGSRRAWLGIQSSDQGDKTLVRQVVAGSPAYEAGVNIGDEIVALNGYRVRSNDLVQRVSEMHPGESVRLSVFREDELREFTIGLRAQEVPSYTVAKVDRPTALQKKILERWLNAKWGDL